jgi:NAD(P)-dependent dehydrogenase (short-subunit alcohol dehydrogenase family)
MNPQLAVKQMLAQKAGGSVVTITAALARNPIRGVTAVPMITKGGLETIAQHLAMEYAKDGIRVNAVAPGPVYTPLHRNTPQDVMESLSPMGRPSMVKDIADAVMYLTRGRDRHGPRLVRRWRRAFRPLVMVPAAVEHQ